ncbi:MAG: hypothetical protein QXW79_01395 [Thermoplasmata archaeon]
MEDQYVHQIKKMDYWTLVNLLMCHISPTVRKYILERLTELNNELLTNNLPFNDKNVKPSSREIFSDELDRKLAKIKMLRDKILSNKRRRYREKKMNNEKFNK